jgi:DNA polymerase-3 subunit beta
MPQPTDEDDTIPIPADEFREMIAMVAFAAARDDSRPILTGVSISFQDGILTMAAADGFRLSVREIALDVEYYGTFSLVVPSKTLQELARIIDDDDEFVNLVLPADRSQVLFHMKNVEVVSQLIDGAFPDYRQIIPPDTPTRTVVDTVSLLQACQRADIFAREANHTVRMSIEPQDGMAGILRVTAQSSETGENEVVLDASIEGEGMEVAFNVRYLIDVLKVIHFDRVMIGTTSVDKPGVVRPVTEDRFTHVVMPMHIGR